MEKKPITIRLERNRRLPFKRALYSNQFFINDHLAAEGIVEIVFAPKAGPNVNLGVIFDSYSLRDNYKNFLAYLASIHSEPAEGAQLKLLQVGEYHYANTLQLSNTGQRAELWFGHALVHDTATARKKGAEEAVIDVEPMVAVYSSLGTQKKLISELFRVLGFE